MPPASVFDQILDFGNRADPYPLYAELRRTPVSRAADGSYVVSTYREIVGLLHDPRVSSDPRYRPDYPGTDDNAAPGLPPSFISLDPPEHDRIRRLLTRHFGPPHEPDRIASMAPDLAEIVGSLIDDLADRHQADLVEQVTYPFPVTVICRLLGVPREDQPRFRRWADIIISTIDPTTGDFATRKRRGDKARAELGAYLGELADADRDHPGDDMLSELATEDGPEGRLSRDELMSNAALLLIAGHETTVNLISNGVLTLLRHPEILQRLRRQPDLSARIVEELLRYEPPVQFLPNRTALDDIEVAGTTIPRGGEITLVLAAGSRDPEHVANPDQFDPDRPANEHLGFGGGIHYCFGAPLARTEAQIALPELVRRLENLRLASDPPPYRPSPVLRGPRHLPVQYDRVAPAPAAVGREQRKAGRRLHRV
ncbi:MAG TPA: cytochrome P450 [Streptosporangiaceae bacterium]|nr:cytochrome P450 [Streptosporangiaceae bacterium]